LLGADVEGKKLIEIFINKTCLSIRAIAVNLSNALSIGVIAMNFCASSTSIYSIYLETIGLQSAKSKGPYLEKRLMPTLRAEWTTSTLQSVYTFVLASRKKINPNFSSSLRVKG
jgi:hypothetical protein